MNAVVEIRSGRVRGERRSGVACFRGIPFARPPLGPLRFRAPELEEPWAGIRDVTEPGPGAPQRTGLPARLAGVGGAARRGDEDCLTLDVFTPQPDGARRPVLVWIHGGAFVFGTGSAPVYDGRWLACRGDVVVVSLHYRLGALGFLSLGELLPEGPFASNVGLRDQIAALEWVRDNIAVFGGDPSNVTMFGESAGAMSVVTLLGCPSARGLFRRAIAQSGAGHNCSSRERAARVSERFLRELELPLARAEELLRLPPDQLVSAQLRTVAAMGVRTGGLAWQPAVDGELLPESPLEAVAAGLSREVPLLIGTNRDEWNLFLLGDRKARKLDEDGLRRRLARALDADDVDSAQQLYRELYPEATPRERWGAFQTHRIFRAPAEHLAELQAAHQSETYAYLLTWSPPGLRRRVGACHTLDIPLVFGSWRHPILRGLFLGGARTSRRMQDAWLAFARGEPPRRDWPRYTADTRQLHTFGPKDPRAESRFSATHPFWTTQNHGPKDRGDLP
jgi:para-nitrobenzyl esterase